jgi:hypothetical protein
VPCLIWAVAQDVRFFVAAAMMNSLWRISHTAWTCLMVEDAEERYLVHIWTWIMISAVCSAFFAPLDRWFVEPMAKPLRPVHRIRNTLATSNRFIQKNTSPIFGFLRILGQNCHFLWS